MTPANVLLGMAVVVLLGWIVASRVAREVSIRAGRTIFDKVDRGMTVPDVDLAIMGSVPCMVTEAGMARIYHERSGTFMIAVVFEPDPAGPASRLLGGRRMPDDWVAKEKIFLELARGGRLDDVMVGLGLRPRRMVEVERAQSGRGSVTNRKP